VILLQEKIAIFSNFEYIAIYRQNIRRKLKISAKSRIFWIFLEFFYSLLKRKSRGLRTNGLLLDFPIKGLEGGGCFG
jgi:hypothetical protein